MTRATPAPAVAIGSSVSRLISCTLMTGVSPSDAATLRMMPTSQYLPAPTSGTFGVAHGQTLATMLPHVMRFNLKVVADRYADVGLALGADRDAEAAIAAIERLSATVGTNRSLGDLGAKPSDLESLTTDALRDMIILSTPRYPVREEVQGLYELAM